MADVWDALRAFIGDAMMHGNHKSADTLLVSAPSHVAVDAMTMLLAEYPLTTLFDLLREATVSGKEEQVRTG